MVRAMDLPPRRHTAWRMVAGVAVAPFALLACLVTAVFVAAAVNPGYDRHWSLLAGAAVAAPIAAALVVASSRLLGAGRRLARIVAAISLAVMVGLVFAGGFAQRPDRRSDVARNLRFLGSIHSYPGSERSTVASFKLSPDGDVFNEGFLNPSPGYSTEVGYVLPRGVTEKEALAFYRAELRRLGWNHLQVYASDCSNVSGANAPACGPVVSARSGYSDIVTAFVYRRHDGRTVVTVQRVPS